MTAGADMSAQPCVQCGEPTLSVVEVARAGVVVAESFMCRTCQGAALEGFRNSQRQFQQLLVMGCDREQANRIMIKRIEREARA